MSTRTRSRRSKNSSNKRAKTTAKAAPETAEEPPPPAATAPHGFGMLTIFIGAAPAPEAFAGYKGFADGSITKAYIRVVPDAAYNDGVIDWAHPSIFYVSLDDDKLGPHLEAAIRLSGAHNGFSHRLLLGTQLVGASDWLGLAKESA